MTTLSTLGLLRFLVEVHHTESSLRHAMGGTPHPGYLGRLADVFRSPTGGGQKWMDQEAKSLTIADP